MNTDYDKRLAEASKTLGAGAIKMISLILNKHDAAVIEASIEAIEAAVKDEREACAKVCDRFAARQMHPAECAAAIRARGNE
jgi:hypothetical protein